MQPERVTVMGKILQNALLLATAILLALIAGRAFWVWLGESPFGMTGATYVDFFQHLDQRIAFPIAIIGILGPLLAGVSATVSVSYTHLTLPTILRV